MTYAKKETVPYKIIFLLYISITLTSCGTFRKAASGSKGTSSVHNDVIDYGKKYLGRPYRYAAKGPQAFDCSGFTSYVFKKFGYNLSPSSSGQDRQTRTIRRKEDLQIGDLVFFEGRKHNAKVGHVGIVTEIKSGSVFRFIHASTSNGIIISSSTEPYYASRYLRGGRVLENIDQTVASNKKDEKHRRPDKRENAFITAKPKASPKDSETEGINSPGHNYKPVPIGIATLHPDSISTVIHRRPAELISETAVNPYLLDPAPCDSTKRVKEVKQHLEAATMPEETGVPKPVETESDTTRTTFIHVVKIGETLYAISRKYNCTVNQIRRWNPGVETIIKPGNKIYIYDSYATK